MRDDRLKWTAPRGEVRFDLGGGTTLTQVKGLQLTLRSGTNVLNTTDLPQVGWPDIAPDGEHVLVMRRDRLLCVGGDTTAEGWDDTTQQAVSNMSDGYAVFDLSGDLAFQILQAGTEISLTLPSRSVVRQTFGLGLLIHRIKDEDTYRLYALRYNADALIGHIQAVASGLQR